MSIIAIGYAFSHSLTDRSHLSPALFYNEAELDHINWVNTIYPRFENPDDSFPNCVIQLTNYLSYYQANQVVVIGGDISSIQAICKLKKRFNLFLLHATPTSIQKEWISSTPPSNDIAVFNSNDMHSMLSALSEKPSAIDPKQPINPMTAPNVLAIDASYWNDTNDFDTLHSLSQYPFQIIMITGYNAETDTSKELFNHLKAFIQQATS